MKLKFALMLILVAFFLIGGHCGPKPPKTIATPIEVEKPPEEAPKPVEPTPVTPPPAPLTLTTIHFNYDKSDLRADALDIMGQNAKSLTDNPDARVRIEGNCDERGTAQYNMALGQRRADSAKDYFVKYGVDAGRLETISYGKSRPVDPGHNEDAWGKNRRDDFVEIAK